MHPAFFSHSLIQCACVEAICASQEKTSTPFLISSFWSRGSIVGDVMTIVASPRQRSAESENCIVRRGKPVTEAEVCRESVK